MARARLLSLVVALVTLVLYLPVRHYAFVNFDDPEYITQNRIARSRLAGDPPDVLINLNVGQIGVFDFDRAEDLIALGREAVRRARDDIVECFDLAPAAER